MVLKVAEADLQRQADFVNVKGAPGVPQIARRRERSASGLHDSGVGRVRARMHQTHRRPGTEGSNPEESAANPESLDQAVLISGGPQVKRRRVPAPGPDRPHVIASHDRAAPKSKQRVSPLGSS
jgi:hypothetical protein